MTLRNTLQLKISYAKYLLQTLPKGRVGTYRQRQVVFISRDPERPDISSKKERRLYTDSKKGAKYLKLISQYQNAKAEYDKLMNEWKTYFAGSPTIIKFPLDQNLLSGLTPEFFKNARPNKNTFENKDPIEYNGQIMRSKNELLAVKEIEKMGFEWKTEVYVNINGKRFYPDVTFHVPFIQCALMLETEGKMGDPEYRKESINREYKYYQAGFNLFDDVIIYRTKNSHSFDSDLLKFEIDMAIEKIATRIIEGTSEIPYNHSIKNGFQTENPGIWDEYYDDQFEG